MPQPKNQVQLICESCGKEFSVKESASRGRRFCGWKCALVAGAQTKITVACSQCGKEIQTYKKRPARYCSTSCGITARNLTDQNPSYSRDISGDKNPMFGKGLFGKDNPMFGKSREQSPTWRGGRKIRKDKYILVVAPADHPYPQTYKGTKYVLEHRFVMEQHIGRFLSPQEVVHHINGNPTDNRIDNLRLYANQSEHIRKGHAAR